MELNHRTLRFVLLLSYISTAVIAAGAHADVDPELISEAIEAIRRKGGTLRLDPKRGDRPPIEANLDGAGDGNRVLEQVKLLTTLKTLRLDGSQVDDKGVLEHLPTVKGLRTLSLGENISDRGLKSLKGMTQLETLYLGSRITDAGLAELSHLTGLRRLYLSNAQITDAGLETLQQMPNLETLMLAGTQVSNAGLPHLERLKHLHTLSLSFTGVTDVGLDPLQRLDGLRRLFLTDTAVTDAGVKNLQDALPDLRILR